MSEQAAAGTTLAFLLQQPAGGTAALNKAQARRSLLWVQGAPVMGRSPPPQAAEVPLQSAACAEVLGVALFKLGALFLPDISQFTFRC